MIKNIRTFLDLIFDKLMVLAGVLLVMIPTSPINSPYAERDSGVFLYTGWRILNGELPYVDVWDQKPPVIYYINALGLAIGNNSRWGVWVIQFISLLLAAFLAYKLIETLFGYFPAMMSTYLWLISLVFLVHQGNYTTEYTLPMQFATLLIFLSTRNHNNKFLRYFFIGVLGGIAFLTKQTAIGLWITIVIILIYTGFKTKSLRKNFQYIVYLFCGVSLVIFICCFYFYLKGALKPLWEYAFFYNYFYVTGKVSGLVERLQNFFTFAHITITEIFAFSALGIFLFIAYTNKRKFNQTTKAFLLFTIVNLIIELILINVPGRTFSHYFMTVLPAMTILSAVLFYVIDSWVKTMNYTNYQRNGLILFAVFLLGLGNLSKYWKNVLALQDRTLEPAIVYTLQNSTENDYIFVWGDMEPMVNFHSQRKSPSRFAFIYPLYIERWVTEEIIVGFLDDLIENKPVIIFDTQRIDYPVFQFSMSSDQINNKLNLIRSNYELVGEVNQWNVYKLVQ
jgi:4-amino-4-deoxy-L-arabinose transferase-like glycosyltransferase